MYAWYGERLEIDLFKHLKARYEDLDESLAVFHSLEILKLDGANDSPIERDFVLVSATYGYIMAIEVKKNLEKTDTSKGSRFEKNGELGSLDKAVNQLKRTFEDLKSYIKSGILPDDINIEDWIFVPMVYHKTEKDVTICESCRQHILKSNLDYNDLIYHI